MRVGTRALEFAKDGFFMGEKIADKTVVVTFVHCQRITCAGPENTRREILRKGRDKRLLCGSEFDEAGKVCGNGVEGGDVGKAKLTERVLKNRDARFW